jgi:DNA-binding NarL/FixJ family response regulator
MTDQELRDLASDVLTARQLEVWRLHEAGMTERGIALHLGLARATIRDHLEAATRRLGSGAKETTP